MLTEFDAPTAGWLLLAGRILIALVYLVSGVHKAIRYQKAVEEFKMAGAPLIPVTLPGTILLHIAAAICLILGIYTQLAALALVAFTIPATLIVHGFWRLTGVERLIRSRIFLSHFGLVGGLLYIAAVGPGHYALS